MSTRSNIAIKLMPKDFNKDLAKHLSVKLNDDSVYPIITDENRPFLEIYCHFDGYLSGVGAELAAMTDYEKIKEEILLGSTSSIDNGEWVHYAVSPKYGEKWEDNAPDVLDEPQLGQEYLYVFMDGKWYVQFAYGDKADGTLYGLDEMLFEEENKKD